MSLTKTQCALPVFEGILPRPHNKLVQDLIFMLCMWHTLAKLQLHTSTTLKHLQTMTKKLSKILWSFAKTTHTDFETTDLPHEQAAWAWRHAAKDSTKRTGGGASTKKTSPGATRRFFNLLTYKLHSLGDYFWAILMYGSTDNYSMQVVQAPVNLYIYNY